jgi:NAD(P)-dependent dehydrogenase (short-subunit alcohol dehydrogenase family)
MASLRDIELPDLKGRTVIVTGANSGLGRVTATALAGAGARVVLAVRDLAKGNLAAAAMTGAAVAAGGSVEVRRLDLASLRSVRVFAAGWDGPLDLLINNAGVMAPPLTRSEDGFELQLATNHLGHFALTNLLLPYIESHGRVVSVASVAHRVGRIDWDDLNWERRRYSAARAYGQSKLANLLFIAELQRRLTSVGSDVLAAAAHPGYAATNLPFHSGNRIFDGLSWIGNVLFAQSAGGGALPTLYAATAPIPPGAYVGPGFLEIRGRPKLVVASARAQSADDARRLWQVSEELTGTSFPLATGEVRSAAPS